MQADHARRAVAAATATATALDLAVEDAIVLNDSNRLVVRLLPCDVVARLTPTTHSVRIHHASAQREIELVHRLAQAGAPVAPLDRRVGPRVFVRDGFEVTLWAYVEHLPYRLLRGDEYADVLVRLHAGLRTVDLATPHFTDRVACAQHDVTNRDVTPDLASADRTLLANTLRDLGRSIAARGAAEQLLHGEPHPWNVLETAHGPLFIDFENTSRGPVEYDLAWVTREAGDRYPRADQALLDDCRGLVLAIIAMHFWQSDNEHPSGREGGVAYLDAVRAGPPWRTCDEVTW